MVSAALPRIIDTARGRGHPSKVATRGQPPPAGPPASPPAQGLGDRLRVRALAALVRAHHGGGERVDTVMGVRLAVREGVLSPAPVWGFSPSVFFARHLGVRAGESVLDVGTGSGLLAVLAARQGARVTAVDCSPAAVACAAENARAAGVPVDVRLGDLFEPVAGRRFDRVLFNAPFHRGEPKDPIDRALFGGRDGEVLRRFAAGLATHLEAGGEARVLLGGVEADALLPAIARDAGLAVRVLATARAPLIGPVRAYGWRPG